MTKTTLVIGNKNYSSWSLRAWLALKRCDIAFDEVVIPLTTPGFKEQIREHSKAGLVPILKHNGLIIWETLAICEYLAETFPGAGLWPQAPAARAYCRSVSNEMHAGFVALRTHMPMDIRNTYRRDDTNPTVEADIQRIVDIWHDCRTRFGQGGPYLFGAYSIADAMFAPVVSRFETYGVDLPETAATYRDTVLCNGNMQAWQAAAAKEPWVIE